MPVLVMLPKGHCARPQLLHQRLDAQCPGHLFLPLGLICILMATCCIPPSRRFGSIRPQIQAGEDMLLGRRLPSLRLSAFVYMNYYFLGFLAGACGSQEVQLRSLSLNQLPLLITAACPLLHLRHPIQPKAPLRPSPRRNQEACVLSPALLDAFGHTPFWLWTPVSPSVL